MEKLSPPVRIFGLIAALVAVGAGLMLFMTGRGSDVAAPVPVQTAAAVPVKPADALPAAKTVAAKANGLAAAAGRQATATTPEPSDLPRSAASAAKPAPDVPQSPTGLPVAVDRALASHELVVVSLVVPGARVDELAAVEARAGAKLAGVGYLALNVLNEGVAHSLLTKLGTLEEPSLLVVKRGGEVALRLNGFIDRDTVAQAAANASA